MNISGIYKIQSNIKPDRIYIGSATNILKRWQSHRNLLRLNKHGNIKLQRHFNKYGESDLSFIILLGCDKNDLLKNEQYFIDSFDLYFNVCKIAGSQLGRKWSLSDEIRNKMSQRLTGHKHSEETKNKIRLSRLGRSNRTGLKHTEESRIKISNAHKGKKRKPFTEETKKRMSNAAKNRNNSKHYN